LSVTDVAHRQVRADDRIAPVRTLSVPESGSASGSPQLPALIEAYLDVAERMTAGAGLDETLRAIVHNACALMNVDRSSVFLRDPASDLFRGCASAALEGVEAQRRMVCGIPADRLSREIVDTRRPVYVPDAQHDNRPVRAMVLKWKVRAVLGAPMIVGHSVIGLLYLDRVDQIDPELGERQELAAMYASMVATVVADVQRADKEKQAGSALRSQVTALRRIHAIEERFARLSQRGAGPVEIARVAADITGNPCYVHRGDFDRVVATAAKDGGHAPQILSPGIIENFRVACALEPLEPEGQLILGPYPECDLRQRCLISAVNLGEDRWGYVTIVESARRLSILDKTVAKCAARSLGLELRVEERIAAVHGDAKRGLARDLLSGSGNTVALNRQAALQGLEVDVPQVVCLVQKRDSSDETPLCPEELQIAFQVAYGTEPGLMTTTEDGAVVLVVGVGSQGAGREDVAQVRSALESALRALDAGLVGSVSSTVDGTDGLAAAFGESQQLMRCLVDMCDPSMLTLSSADLGVGSLLLGACDGLMAKRFVAATIRPLLAADPRVADLLVTLDVFLEAARSAREAAKRLGVHENTIRYRLGRIQDLTGLDVAADLDDQLTAQVALLIVRLQGGLPAASQASVVEATEDGWQPELAGV
jgi:sugar diacid utilization regulator